MSSRIAEFRPPPASGVAATSRPFIRGSDVRELAEPMQNLILKYPGAALASAFLVGVALAWWIKRR